MDSNNPTEWSPKKDCVRWICMYFDLLCRSHPQSQVRMTLRLTLTQAVQCQLPNLAALRVTSLNWMIKIYASRYVLEIIIVFPWISLLRIMLFSHKPLSVRGVPHWRVKSSGVRQSKIYKCHECTYGHWGVKEAFRKKVDCNTNLIIQDKHIGLMSCNKYY